MIPAVTLRQLRYFVVAAETGSMTEAGRVEHVSQSAISLAIGDLERTLGTQLFLRKRSRGLALTASGRHLLGDARDVLRRTEDLVDAGRSFGGQLRGTLAVACYDTIAPFLMPRLLTSFHEAHPEVEIELLGGDMAQLHDQLRTGACELFLAYDLGVDADVATVTLHDTSPYVLLPGDDDLADRESIALADLVPRPLILLDHPQPRRFVLGLFEAAGLRPRVGHRTPSFELVRSLVARGLGYSVLIQRPPTDTSYEGLPIVCRPVQDPPTTLTVAIGTIAGARLTRRAEAFITHCVSQLR